MPEDPFASFNRFGDRVLEGLDRGERPAQKFKYLLGVINGTLLATHQIVLSRLAALQQAKTVEEAKNLLEGLRQDKLTEAFRIEGLCDLLEGLGMSLSGRAWAAHSEGLFPDDELSALEDFGRMLYDREAEVARVYSQVLDDIVRQGDNLTDASLPELQDRAKQVEESLTDQVADFKAKAEKFTRLSTH